MTDGQKRTLCPRDCPDACGIVATVEHGRVVRLSGDPTHPVTQGFLCYRTSQFLQRQYSPDRLQQPLVRKQKGGRLVPVSWDEVLDVLAARLTQIRQESGPAALFHYRGGGSLGFLKDLTDYFFNHFGPVTTKRGSICDGAASWAQKTDFGICDSHDVFDLYNSRHILLWGKNVTVSSPHTLAILRKAKARGTQLVLVDPVHHRTATFCERFVQPRPGTDWALAMGVARVLLDNGWIDPKVTDYCDNFEAFQTQALARSLGSWCAIADVHEDAVRDIAQRLGQDGPTAILVGWGLGRHDHGAASVRAIDALCAISGNVGVPGGGVSFSFRRGLGLNRAAMRGPNEPPRTIPEPLFGPGILAAKAPEIRAVWVTAGNPVAMLPQALTNRQALLSRELVVVVDAFHTDTTDCADIVLPTTTLLEDDDLIGAFGHHWVGTSTPVVLPPANVKTDLEILQALAARVGLRDAMAGSHRDWKQRLMDDAWANHGITLAQLEDCPQHNPFAPSVLFEDRVFPTASGKVNLVTDLPTPIPTDDPDYPLYLMSLSTKDSQSSQWVRTTTDPITATVHPKAANEVREGDMAELRSPHGTLPVRVKYDTRQRPDVVLVPKGGHMRDNRCANQLVTAQLTDAGEGGSLYAQKVRLGS